MPHAHFFAWSLGRKEQLRHPASLTRPDRPHLPSTDMVTAAASPPPCAQRQTNLISFYKQLAFSYQALTVQKRPFDSPFGDTPPFPDSSPFYVSLAQIFPLPGTSKPDPPVDVNCFLSI